MSNRGGDVPEISAIVINYNGQAYLEELLTSLSRQTFHDYELILIDNASEGGRPAPLLRFNPGQPGN